MIVPASARYTLEEAVWIMLFSSRAHREMFGDLIRILDKKIIMIVIVIIIKQPRETKSKSRYF